MTSYDETAVDPFLDALADALAKRMKSTQIPESWSSTVLGQQDHAAQALRRQEMLFARIGRDVVWSLHPSLSEKDRADMMGSILAFASDAREQIERDREVSRSWEDRWDEDALMGGSPPDHINRNRTNSAVFRRYQDDPDFRRKVEAFAIEQMGADGPAAESVGEEGQGTKDG